MVRALVVAMIIAGLAATALPAQEAWVPQPGQRIKIKSPDVRGEFVVQRAGPDTLYVGNGGETRAVPIASISQIKIRLAPNAAG